MQKSQEEKFPSYCWNLTHLVTIFWMMMSWTTLASTHHEVAWANKKKKNISQDNQATRERKGNSDLPQMSSPTISLLCLLDIINTESIKLDFIASKLILLGTMLFPYLYLYIIKYVYFNLCFYLVSLLLHSCLIIKIIIQYACIILSN